MNPFPASVDSPDSYVTVVTPSTEEVVSVLEVKKHLKIDYSDEDGLILDYIQAATEYGETYQRRTFTTKTLACSFTGWPCGRIELKRGPIQSISSVKYYDVDGVLQTVASSNYWLDYLNQACVINPTFNLPAAQNYRPGSVVVQYVAGYGTDPKLVPASTRQAIRFLAAHWFANRTPIQPGTMGEVPLTVTALLEAHRLYYR
jgi:uncharacterized phiE125 gp8 family phage protein